MSATIPTIAVMGREGSYHDTAAGHYFGPAYERPLHCASFDEVFGAVTDGSARYGVTAIENSIIGSLSAPHDLLRAASSLAIVGEVSLRIHHSLAAVPGTALSDIKEVRSHPAAIGQCSTFLERHLSDVILRQVSDTATAVHDIARMRNPSIAAIADPETAERYELSVLARDIADQKNNRTRFVILAKKDEEDSQIRRLLANKTTLLLDRIADRTPAQGRRQLALGCFAMANISVLRTYEHPIQEEPDQSCMFVDVACGGDQAAMLSAVQALTLSEIEWRELGTYQQGKTF